MDDWPELSCTDEEQSASARAERLRFGGSKDWFYCPTDAMETQLQALRARLDHVALGTFGLTVLTDSTKLAGQLREFERFTGGYAQREPSGDLYYVTQSSNHQPIPNPAGTTGLTEMSSKPADTAFDPISGVAVINAWDRFTSMESLALGMFSYRRAKQGFFGVQQARTC